MSIWTDRDRQIDVASDALMDYVPRQFEFTGLGFTTYIGQEGVVLPIVRIPNEQGVCSNQSPCIAYLAPNHPEIQEIGARWMAEQIRNLEMDNPLLVTPGSLKSEPLMRDVARQLGVPLMILERTTDFSIAQRNLAEHKWVDCYEYYAVTSPKPKYLGITAEQLDMLRKHPNRAKVDDVRSTGGTENAQTYYVGSTTNVYLAVEGNQQESPATIYATRLQFWENYDQLEDQYERGGVYQ